MFDEPVAYPRLYSYLMKQDDPRKCTSAKLARLGFIRPLYRLSQIPSRAVVLNPLSSALLFSGDRSLLRGGLVAIDCSWKRIDEAFSIRFRGISKRLPLFLASNPVNYGQLGILSSAEALAAALYITSHIDAAKMLLSKFKWGQTFFDLNMNPLEDYRKASSTAEVLMYESSYFPRLQKG